MADAVVIFEREDAEGIVAVGSYVGDAGKRFGVRFSVDCMPAAGEHCCAVEIKEGMNLLSAKTETEKQFLLKARLGKNWRLACHAKIEKPGEVVVMTKEKEKEKAEDVREQAEDYRKRFEDLPLEKKMAELVRLEGIALSETMGYIINSPYKAADKLMDVMAEFGFRMDAEKKESAKPEEHRTNGADDAQESTEGGAEKNDQESEQA